MKVTISEDVLSEATCWRELDQLMYLFIDGWHIWEFDEKKVLESKWYLSEGGRLRSLIQDAIEASLKEETYLPALAQMHSRRILVTNAETEPYEISIDYATKFLRHPVLVFVENADSDGKFLWAMLHAYGRTHVMNARERGLWKIEHCGGITQIIPRIEATFASTKLPALRIYVLCDSDGRAPGHIHENAAKVRQFCISWDIPCHILNKRESQNYIPLSVLSGIKEHEALCKSLSALSAEQYSFFNMRAGFRKDANDGTLCPPQDELYGDIPRPMRKNELFEGFGPDVGNVFESHLALFTKEAVEAHCGSYRKEIQVMINQLERLI